MPNTTVELRPANMHEAQALIDMLQGRLSHFINCCQNSEQNLVVAKTRISDLETVNASESNELKIDSEILAEKVKMQDAMISERGERLQNQYERLKALTSALAKCAEAKSERQVKKIVKAALNG